MKLPTTATSSYLASVESLVWIIITIKIIIKIIITIIIKIILPMQGRTSNDEQRLQMVSRVSQMHGAPRNPEMI